MSDAHPRAEKRDVGARSFVVGLLRVAKDAVLAISSHLTPRAWLRGVGGPPSIWAVCFSVIVVFIFMLNGSGLSFDSHLWNKGGLLIRRLLLVVVSI